MAAVFEAKGLFFQFFFFLFFVGQIRQVKDLDDEEDFFPFSIAVYKM